jgi:hypothetical protein
MRYIVSTTLMCEGNKVWFRVHMSNGEVKNTDTYPKFKVIDNKEYII